MPPPWRSPIILPIPHSNRMDPSLHPSAFILLKMTVYGSNHIALEVTDPEAAATFYQEVFGLERLREGEGQAFLRLGPHQFLAIFRAVEAHRDNHRHFGI